MSSLDITDDRFEAALRYLSDNECWAHLESALNEHTVRIYDLLTERVHVDSTTASVYSGGVKKACFSFSFSSQHRHYGIIEVCADKRRFTIKPINT